MQMAASAMSQINRGAMLASAVAMRENAGRH
jgi:hypothetical protein